MGRTPRGNGSRILLMTDRCGTPLSAFVTAAHHNEVNTIETLVDDRISSPISYPSLSTAVIVPSGVSPVAGMVAMASWCAESNTSPIEGRRFAP